MTKKEDDEDFYHFYRIPADDDNDGEELVQYQ